MQVWRLPASGQCEPSPKAASQALLPPDVRPLANDERTGTGNKCRGTWRKSSLGPVCSILEWPHSCSFGNLVYLCLSLFCLLPHHFPRSLNTEADWAGFCCLEPKHPNSTSTLWTLGAAEFFAVDIRSAASMVGDQ